MKTSPLANGYVIEIVDFSLRSAFNCNKSRFTLCDLLLADKVLIFRNQFLEEDEHVQAASLFGEVHKESAEGENSKPRIRYVSNKPMSEAKTILPQGKLHFHSDYCFDPKPYKATTLNAIEVPNQGGETLFSDVASAYEKLPDQLKTMLVSLTALNSYDGSRTIRSQDQSPDEKICNHPCIIRHPETGEPLLFVNRLMTTKINELNPDEGADLLERLFDLIEAKENIYRHSWKAGDFVIWDNLAVQHARTSFSSTDKRVLRRLAIEGTNVEGISK